MLALGAAAGRRVATPQASSTIPTTGDLSLLEASTQAPWDQASLAIELEKPGWVKDKNVRIEPAYADWKCVDSMYPGRKTLARPSEQFRRGARRRSFLVRLRSQAPEVQRIVEFANTNRIPTFYDIRAFAKAGELLTYGPGVSRPVAQLAGHVDHILRGANPASLPVEMPTRYELLVDRKTAKALGLTIPQSVLARADDVI